MRTLSIKQLHASTGRWVREARTTPIVVTDRGERVAMLVAVDPARLERPVFRGRDMASLPRIARDSTEVISSDRDGR
jgi:antitoxin (DNA-binding transcriptional repressor) of toxin-antitoxin stability system